MPSSVDPQANQRVRHGRENGLEIVHLVDYPTEPKPSRIIPA